MTDRKKAPKLGEVLQRFFPKLNELMKLLRCERSGTNWGTILLIIGSEMCYVKCVWYSLKHRCNHRSKRIEAVRFYHISCGTEQLQVWNPFAQRRHHVSTCTCLLELKTEFELEQAISMHLRNKITVVRNVRTHHLSLLNAKHKTQLSSV